MRRPGPFRFGKFSEQNLYNVEEAMVRLAREVVRHRDITVADGIREYEEQEKNVAKGVSKTMDSKHLAHRADGTPCVKGEAGKSRALDITPANVDWPAVTRGMNAMFKADPSGSCAEFYMLIGYIQGTADQLGIPIRSGADWNLNNQVDDQTFHDLPHHEMLEEK